MEKLTALIQQIKVLSGNLSDDEKESVNESLKVIENESRSVIPKKSMIKTALNSIKSIARTTEFCAAVTTLAKYFGF